MIVVGQYEGAVDVSDNTNELSNNIRDIEHIEQKADVNKNVAEQLEVEVDRFKLN